jgi:hypothetical protein
MSTPKFVALAFAFLLFLSSSPLFGQQPTTKATSAGDEATTDRFNLEVEINLIVASSDPATKSTMPKSREQIFKQLQKTLPGWNYSLAATYTNWVKNGSSVESKGVIAADLVQGRDLTGTTAPYEYTMKVKLATDGPNPAVEIPLFRFGLQLPTIVGMNPFKLEYHLTAITTELSLREATPTVVATLTTTNPNQILVLVVSVRRTQ